MKEKKKSSTKSASLQPEGKRLSVNSTITCHDQPTKTQVTERMARAWCLLCADAYTECKSSTGSVMDWRDEKKRQTYDSW